MAIIHGSMRYTMTGRKRKVFTKARRKESVVFHTLNREEPNIRETPKYPSAPMTPYRPAKDQSYKREVSAGYTIAPAYNKGAYQVISQESIEDIGR